MRVCPASVYIYNDCCCPCLFQMITAASSRPVTARLPYTWLTRLFCNVITLMSITSDRLASRSWVRRMAREIQKVSKKVQMCFSHCYTFRAADGWRIRRMGCIGRFDLTYDNPQTLLVKPEKISPLIYSTTKHIPKSSAADFWGYIGLVPEKKKKNSHKGLSQRSCSRCHKTIFPSVVTQPASL